MDPLVLFPLALLVILVLTYIVSRKKNTATMPPDESSARPTFRTESKVITIGDPVLYKQNHRSRRPAPRNAQVTGFKTARGGGMLICLRDLFGNKFSVVESRIL